MTGLPRMRSAWLSAVLGKPDLPCIHDFHVYRHIHGTLPEQYGLCDPTAVLAKVKKKDYPLVLVKRDEEEAYKSFTRKFGEFSKSVWAGCVNYLTYLEAVADLVVPYAELNDNAWVKEIARVCTGETLSSDYLKTMQLLHIEQSDMKIPSNLLVGELKLDM